MIGDKRAWSAFVADISSVQLKLFTVADASCVDGAEALCADGAYAGSALASTESFHRIEKSKLPPPDTAPSLPSTS